MQENISEIREAFSKASIVIDNAGISAIYTDIENFITQPGKNNADSFFRVFRNLIGSSKEFDVSIVAGKSIKLKFKSKDLTSDTVFYPPMEHQISIEELREVFDEDSGGKKSREFVEFLSGIDFSDDDDRSRKFNEWFDRLARENPEPISLPARIRFNKMLTVLHKLNSVGFLSHDIMEPEIGFHGCMSIDFEDNPRNNKRFFGKSKSDLLKLIDLSTGISFELNVDSGIFGITFYA